MDSTLNSGLPKCDVVYSWSVLHHGQQVEGHRKCREACIAWRDAHDRNIQLARGAARDGSMAEAKEVVLHGPSVAETYLGVGLYLLEAPLYDSGSEKSNETYTGPSKK